MIGCSYSGPSERAKSRNYDPLVAVFLEWAVTPLPLTSLSRPPDVIHVMNETSPSPFFALFRFHVLYWTQTEGLKRGRPENEATLLHIPETGITASVWAWPFFLVTQDLRTSKGLSQEMKRIVEVNVSQVITFELRQAGLPTQWYYKHC